jgi:hypothetical protein
MIRDHTVPVLPAVGKLLAISLGLTLGIGGVAAVEIWPSSLPRLVFASAADADADGQIQVFVSMDPSVACAVHQPRWLWLPRLSAQGARKNDAAPERNTAEPGSMAARSSR